jgi:hypothetical protein
LIFLSQVPNLKWEGVDGLEDVKKSISGYGSGGPLTYLQLDCAQDSLNHLLLKANRLKDSTIDSTPSHLSFKVEAVHQMIQANFYNTLNYHMCCSICYPC